MRRFLLFLAAVTLSSSLSAQELKLRRTLACHAKRAVFSPDGKSLASMSDSEEVKLWDLATGKNTIGMQGKVKVWDAFSGKSIATLSGLSEEVIGGSFERTFSSDGKTLVLLMSDDKTIKVFDVKTSAAAKD